MHIVGKVKHINDIIEESNEEASSEKESLDFDNNPNNGIKIFRRKHEMEELSSMNLPNRKFSDVPDEKLF